MRLTEMHLNGFKSFVDPTKVHFPSNLVAVVGPNGCGKSNIIDAVRWLMGETSAKHLRGESMTDVIFNGTTGGRKPAGQASVELIFDNSDGKITGEYAGFNEISVKRVMTRDGDSQYYLNNTKCRRKDITSLFLGTGLGARSYSIIEQGMISRIIEAKPDDLRIYIEEAAGISKYKERRRETETRIRHTRENLERLTDIRDELGKHLERLDRQSQAAERYQVLKQEEKLVKAQWHALKWQSYNSELIELTSSLSSDELKLESCIAEHRRLDAAIEEWREKRVEVNEEYSELQQRYYGLATEIARLEQAIQSQRERKQQLESDLQEAQIELAAATSHVQDDQNTYEQLTTELSSARPEAELAKEQYESSQLVLSDMEVARTEWQQRWDDFNQQAAESSKQAHVEQARIQHLEQQIQQNQQRSAKLEEEIQKFDEIAMTQAISQFKEQEQQIHIFLEEWEQKIADTQEAMQQQRIQNQDLQRQLDSQKEQLQRLYGRFASVTALQQAALGKQSTTIVEWLSAHHLENNARLAESLQVSNGWERAVETVLGQYLQAVCVDDIASVSQHIANLNGANLTLYSPSLSAHASDAKLTTLLLSHIQSPAPGIASLLQGVYAADDLTTALHYQNKLQAQESIITADGIWIGPNWLRIAKDDDVHSGVLAREQELQVLQQDIQTAEHDIETLTKAHEQGHAKIFEYEASREAILQQKQDYNHQLSEISAQLKIKQGQLQQLRSRSEQISQELSQLINQYQTYTQELSQARETWQIAMQSMESDIEARQLLSSQREQLSQQLEEQREQARQYREKTHQASLRVQAAESQLSATQQNLQRMNDRVIQLRARTEGLRLALEETNNPSRNLHSELEIKLAQHQELEISVGSARQRLEHIDSQLHECEQERYQYEEKSREIRESLDQRRLDAQTLRVRQTTVSEALAETEFTLEELLKNLPETANEPDWAARLESIGNKISRLGPINLAAIEEFKTESERKTYLDSQHNDLIEALTILESAIEKIDQETKQRFRETFDTVNNSFKTLFPALFGGGEAYLDLIDDDLLHTGVTVMARPPGKRNSSIHLLSGGEKAMTAVALVFAIFQLNPSPFCMLDEVDAPLDEANVTRFCKMVKQMSQTVQFVFITHNKVTMELADHLSGVTMHEPGVSRMVSVDVGEALALAEA